MSVEKPVNLGEALVEAVRSLDEILMRIGEIRFQLCASQRSLDGPADLLVGDLRDEEQLEQESVR